MLIAFNKPYGVLSQFTSDGSPNRTLAEFGFPKSNYPIGRLDADSEGLLLLSDEPGLNQRLLHPRHAHEREYWAQIERIPTAEALQTLARGLVIQGRKTLPCRAWLLEPQPEVVEHAQPHPDPLPSDGSGNSDSPAQLSRKRIEQAPASVVTQGSEGLSLSRRTREGRGEGFGSGAHGAPRPSLPPRDPPIRFRKSVPDCWIGLELVEGKNRQVRRMTAAIGHPTLRLLRVRIGGFRLGNLGAGQWKHLDSGERTLILGQGQPPS